MCYVDKYCCADDVYRRTMELYTHTQDSVLERVTMEGRTKVLGFYSPDGGDMQTTFALTYGQLLSKKSRVLYVSFAPFPCYPELVSGDAREDLMTLLYYLEHERFGVTLQNAVRRIGEMHTLSAKSGNNLVYITKEQWQTLLAELLRHGDYDYVLLDLKDSVQGLYDLLTRCRVVYTLTKGGEMAEQKLSQYKELLSSLAAEHILQKTRYLCLPMFRKLPSQAYELTGSELADYVQMVLRRESE